MSDDPAPEFEFVADHKFAKGEKVYVIEPNGYDIWEAEINEVKSNGTYAVHYPAFPEDDCDISEEDKRILVQTKKNKKIFDEQEEVRNEKEEESEEAEDHDYVEEDDDEKPKKK